MPIKIRKKDVRRFLSKVRKSDPGYCWTWIATCDRDGYGLFWFNGMNFRAAKFAYTIAFGEVEKGKHILHKCDNPSCVNPNHLFVGTALINMRDKCKKGRQAKGETCGRSKYTEKQVLKVRRLFRKYNSYAKAARIVGMSEENATDICKRRTWRHI